MAVFTTINGQSRLPFIMAKMFRFPDFYFPLILEDGFAGGGGWEADYDVPYTGLIEAYQAAGWGSALALEDYTSWVAYPLGNLPMNYETDDIPLVPVLFNPNNEGYTRQLFNWRLAWYCIRLEMRLFVWHVFASDHHRPGRGGGLDEDEHERTSYSMAFGNRALKNAGKWFRVNEIIRHNATLKTIINADPIVQARGFDMLTTVANIALHNGYTLDPATEVPATKKANMFPITKQFWMGYLPISVQSTAAGHVGEDLYRTDFAAKAKDLRTRVQKLVDAWKLAADAFNTADVGNPGGPV